MRHGATARVAMTAVEEAVLIATEEIRHFNTVRIPRDFTAEGVNRAHGFTTTWS